MHQIKRQTAIAMIESIEHQLATLKTILFMNEGPGDTNFIAPKKDYEDPRYTNEAEDALIEESLALDHDEKEKLVQDIVKNTELNTEDGAEQY